MILHKNHIFKRARIYTDVIQVEHKISQITIIYQQISCYTYLWYKTLKDDDVMISIYKKFILWHVSLLLLPNTVYTTTELMLMWMWEYYAVCAPKCLGTGTDVISAPQPYSLLRCICGTGNTRTWLEFNSSFYALYSYA